jgi:hypothetical protein
MGRCLNCGDIIDNVVVFNRLHTLTNFHKRGRLHQATGPASGSAVSCGEYQ